MNTLSARPSLSFIQHVLMFSLFTAAIGLVIAALWAWEQAPQWIGDGQPARPQIMLWAVRSAAIGAVALAQVLGISAAVGCCFRRGFVDDLFRVICGGISAVALVTATSLALAGR